MQARWPKWLAWPGLAWSGLAWPGKSSLACNKRFNTTLSPKSHDSDGRVILGIQGNNVILMVALDVVYEWLMSLDHHTVESIRPTPDHVHLPDTRSDLVTLSLFYYNHRMTYYYDSVKMIVFMTVTVICRIKDT